jgi:hypothetical protein
MRPKSEAANLPRSSADIEDSWSYASKLIRDLQDVLLIYV